MLKYPDWGNLRSDTQESISRARVLEVARTFLELQGPDLPMIGQLDALLAELAWQGLRGGDGPLVAEFTIDSGDSPIQTGLAGYLAFPEMNLNITGWQTIGSPDGTIVFDLWKRAYGAGRPDVSNTIITTGKPNITAGSENRLASVPDWDVALLAGDKLALNVDSNDTVTKVTLAISFERALV